jgi:DNA-binding NtrC family response regulator
MSWMESMVEEGAFGTKLSELPHHRVARVIVAEDDEEMRKLLIWSLRREGYEIVEADDGLQLLARIMSAHRDGVPVDLVISDVRMPGFTGLDVLERLQRSGYREPFILITGFGDRNTHEAADRLGAWAVLDKPFDFDHLREVARTLIKQRLRRSLRGPEL